MADILIIGAGGVGNVVAHKCAQAPEYFDKITLASRDEDKCRAIAGRVREATGKRIGTAQVDAGEAAQTAALIREVRPALVIHVALPYQDLAIMDACLETGTHYLDTANYEPPGEARFEYKWQWAYREKFEQAGLMALLGSGFDPGVTNVFCAYIQKHHLDEIHEIDILDCNAGDHGYPFATNFNPEINIREISQPGRYWEDGEWKSVEPMSMRQDWDYPEIGPQPSYLLYHEELESLVQHIRGLRRIRFWMTFSDTYLTHLRVLQNVGMTSIEPIGFRGQQIAPIEFLKAVLPDPASLGPRTHGKTNIGCVCKGLDKLGEQKTFYIYNICDHQECFREVGSQAVSYTTGVPAMTGASMMATGKWSGKGVFNMEELDPDPFLEELARRGLPWQIKQL